MDASNYWGRRASRRRILQGGTVAGVGLAGWALAGCGDDDSGSATATKAPATAAASGSAAPAGSATAAGSPAAATPKRGGTLIYGNAGDTNTIDFHKTNSSYANYYGPGNALSGLVRPQGVNNGGKTIVSADLAEKWEQPDPTTYIFHLRSGVKWQNLPPVNGRPFVAADAVYSFNRQIEQKANASTFAGMKSLEAIDAATVKMTFDVPNVDFLGTLSGSVNKVLSKEAVDSKNGDLTTGPIVGTGPWIFKEWTRNVQQTYVRNPDYFIQGQPYLDAMNLVVFSDIAQWQAQFEAGKVMNIFGATGNVGVPISTLKGWDQKKYALVRALQVAPIWVMFQNDHPQMKDPRIRKALNMAIDRQLFNANVFDNEGTPDSIGLAMPDRDWVLPKDELAKLQPFDPKTAKQMFDAAGGVPKLTMPFFESPAVAAAAQIIQSNWKAIGFEVDLMTLDPTALTGTIFNPAVSKFPVCTTAILRASSLTAELEAWYKTGGSRNGGHWADPNLDKLIDAQKQQFDEKARRANVNDIQRLIMDQVYHAPIVAIGNLYAIPRTLHGIEPTPGYGPHFQEVWLDA